MEDGTGSFNSESFQAMETESSGANQGLTMEGTPMTNGYSNGVDTTAAPDMNNHHATPDIKKHSSSHHSSSKDKHKHSNSSSKDKHHHSSSKDKHHSSSSSKHSSSSSSSKHKDGSSSSSSKHRDGHSSSSSHKHSSSSSSKHGSSSSSSHKHSSSSSSSKDKGKHSSSSSKDKHHSSSSSKHRDGHSSSKHSSSGHKSSSKDKERHRDKDRHKDGEHKSEKKPEVKSEEVKVKEEPPATPVKEPVPVSPVKEPTVYSESVKEETEWSSPVKPAPESPRKPVKMEESDSDDDTPLLQRSTKVKAEKRPMPESGDDDDEPLISRIKKVKKEESPTKKRKSDDDDDSPVKKKKKKDKQKGKEVKEEKKGGKKAAKGVKEEPEKWKWWEEERKDDGTKWRFLEHKGPVFAPPYEPLPDHVAFYYDGKRMKLTPETEEVATFYGRMLDHDYTTMEAFNKNFFKDWRKVMTTHEKKITDLKKCNFNEINDYFKAQSEARKNKSKEEKQKLKEENAALVEEYGFCIMDGHKEKIGNFRIEPPGLFRGRGSHPKMGMHKRRVRPEDIIINCSKDSDIPKPPKGHKWKEVRHDNQVTWLCSWNENIQGQTKYIMLNAASKLKGEKDWKKYETARQLHGCVDKIRANYREDWKSKEMRIRQRAVALYFIDKLALRAGNEKEEGESADTVGCCSLRTEHIKLSEHLDGKDFVVEFDFLGKDSIRYYNMVAVEKRVFKNLQLFMNNKAPGDDLFDRLNTTIMNKHLQTLMEGLTAKVFRTYNASKTLQEQLDLLTNADDPIAAKILSYNRANRAVALLCNHQRAAPKNFDQQKENLQNKIDDKLAVVKKARKDLKNAKSNFKASKSVAAKAMVDKKKKALARLEEQLTKLQVNLTDKEENKEIALGTSKLNYLDPRISVAWCKKWDVPIEKIYNKTQRDKFAWAIEMVDEDFVF